MRAFVGLPVLLFSVCVAVAEPRNVEPFGMTAIKAPEGALWNAWRRIRSDIRAQLPRQAQCLVDPDHCNAAERLLRDVVKEPKPSAAAPRSRSSTRASMRRSDSRQTRSNGPPPTLGRCR